MAGELPRQTIHHFSHPHPLVLSIYQSHQTQFPATCSCCKLQVQSPGVIYACNQCNYSLHFLCSQMPTRITHPFDQNHVMSLLATPIYPGGIFNCDACGKPGNGFSYHCGTCGTDLHTVCASLPMVLAHRCHQHQLSLAFSVPYPNNTFNCDVCNTLVSKQWLYSCGLCGFDVHLGCAKNNEPRSSAPVHQGQARFQPAPQAAPVQLAPPVQQVRVQQFQASPAPSVPQYQFVANPMTMRTIPMHTGNPPAGNQAWNQTFSPMNTMNAAAPRGFGLNMITFSTPGAGQMVIFSQAMRNLMRSAAQGGGQSLMQGLFKSGGGGGGIGGGFGDGGGGDGSDLGGNFDGANGFDQSSFGGDSGGVDFCGMDFGGMGGGMDCGGIDFGGFDF